MRSASPAKAKAIALPFALAQAGASKRTGALVSTHRERTRRIWLRDGNPIWVESDDPGEAYTAILAFKGVFTESARMLIESEHAKPGVREEEAIVASGLLGHAEVIAHAADVFEERLLNAFGLAGATWVFEPGDPPPANPVVEMPMAEALLRGLRERYGRERLAVEFPIADGDRYRYDASGLAKHPKLNLSRDEVRLTSHLDGGRGWAAAVTEAGLDPTKAHAALYALALLEIVEYVTPTGNVTPAAGGPAAPTVASDGRPDPKGLLGTGKAAEMQALAAKEMPDVIGVPAEAAPEAVAAGFKAVVSRYDLGRGHWLPEGDREAALALLDRACDAFLVMTHPDARPKYFAAPPWDRETVAAGLAGRFSAEKNYLKAGIFMTAGNHLAAEAALIPAIALAPRDARLHKRMGMCIYLRAKSKGERIPAGALRALEKAVALSPNDDEAWLYLGHVAASHGDKKTARDLYQQALSLNPSSGEARRALMRLDD